MASTVDMDYKTKKNEENCHPEIKHNIKPVIKHNKNNVVYIIENCT